MINFDKKISVLFCSFFLAMIAVGFFSCKQGAEEVEEKTASTTDELGVVEFEVSGAEVAQASFKNGLLLLHSFEYEDARDQFLKAQELDSTFAMAYWGEAMTYNHSLWQRQEKEDAVAALMKLGTNETERAAFLKTDIEKDFFQAIEILFGEGTKYERDIAYRDHMKSLVEKYPDHHEVSAFYAISLLGSSRNGRDEALYSKTAKIAQGIIKENPSHPGALHYLIHSYDDPGHAHLAKLAADSYSKVAPDAAHALHMPSHIYVALGQWNDVIKSNIASWNASLKRMKRKELKTDALSYHALNWLQYGFLQKGMYKEANELLVKMKEYRDLVPNKQGQSYLVAMKGAQLIEQGDASSDLMDITIDTEKLNGLKKVSNHFITGWHAYKTKDLSGLKSLLREVSNIRQKEQINVGEKGFAMCSSAGFASKPSSQLDVDMMQVMEMELKAFRAELEGNKTEAKDWYVKATNLDESLSYSYGPPIILKPVHEAYGEYLLQEGDHANAVEIFEKALKRYPGRLLSLQGMVEAAKRVGDEEKIKQSEAELEQSVAAIPLAEILI